MSDNPNFLDLDDVKPTVELTVKLNGQTHKLEPISVENFIQNLKDQKKLNQLVAKSSEDDPDVVAAQIETIIDMLTRSFPTIGKEELHVVPLPKLWKLLTFAQSYDGSKEVKEDAVAAETAENPQTAG